LDINTIESIKVFATSKFSCKHAVEKLLLKNRDSNELISIRLTSVNRFNLSFLKIERIFKAKSDLFFLHAHDTILSYSFCSSFLLFLLFLLFFFNLLMVNKEYT